MEFIDYTMSLITDSADDSLVDICCDTCEYACMGVEDKELCIEECVRQCVTSGRKVLHEAS